MQGLWCFKKLSSWHVKRCYLQCLPSCKSFFNTFFVHFIYNLKEENTISLFHLQMSLVGLHMFFSIMVFVYFRSDVLIFHESENWNVKTVFIAWFCGGVGLCPTWFSVLKFCTRWLSNAYIPVTPTFIEQFIWCSSASCWISRKLRVYLLFLFSWTKCILWSYENRNRR